MNMFLLEPYGLTSPSVPLVPTGILGVFFDGQDLVTRVGNAAPQILATQEWVEGSAGTGDIKSDGSVPFAADQSMGGFKLTDLADPTDDQDAATKAYVDSSSGSPMWGGIGGTLSNQTDLQTALNAKAPTASPTFTGTVNLPATTVIAGNGRITGNGADPFSILHPSPSAVGIELNPSVPNSVFIIGNLLAPNDRAPGNTDFGATTSPSLIRTFRHGYLLNLLLGLQSTSYTTPNYRLDVRGGTGVSYAQFTNNATGNLSTDGLLIGVTAGGVPTIINQEASPLTLTTSSLSIATAGRGLNIAEGANARMGTATLAAGVATVATTAVTANSRIFVTSQVDGGTPGFLRVSARNAGADFTITSDSGTDTSTVAWLIVEPA